MRLLSEGTKLQKYNMGVAEQEATRKYSEGSAGAKVELARAESKSLEIVGSAFAADGNASQTEYVISQRYMTMFQTMALTLEKKTLFFPYETKGLSGLIRDLRRVYGHHDTEVARLQPYPGNGRHPTSSASATRAEAARKHDNTSTAVNALDALN
jgi:hypothetical protein